MLSMRIGFLNALVILSVNFESIVCTLGVCPRSIFCDLQGYTAGSTGLPKLIRRCVASSKAPEEWKEKKIP